MNSVDLRRRTGRSFAIVAAALLSSACSMMGPEKPPLTTAANVDISRYMGPWHIVASIPFDFEKGAHNAVETYTTNPDGSIATVFQFRRDQFNGELVTYVTKAKVEEGSGNAVWRVRTIWPFTGEYRISWLSQDLSVAIVTNKHNHVWVLSRTGQPGEAILESCRRRIAAMGFDMNRPGFPGGSLV